MEKGAKGVRKRGQEGVKWGGGSRRGQEGVKWGGREQGTGRGEVGGKGTGDRKG